jgi:hypothetical protein
MDVSTMLWRGLGRLARAALTGEDARATRLRYLPLISSKEGGQN